MPDDGPSYDLEIEDFIRKAFEENFEQLRLESGHTIAPDAKEAALNQVLLYWRKLRTIAERVTDTEVRLSLPGQETPRGREYTIEGVVDIVREEGRVVMYDIKTHDADYVRANIDLYEQQLNVYAHIWQELRRQPLDEAAVIATEYPTSVKQALASGDPAHLAHALQQWDPVVPITYDPARKDRTLYEFGQIVDRIEDGEFAPPPVERLQETIPGPQPQRFGTRVCRDCDARFSCDSYRAYFLDRNRGRALPDFADSSDLDQESWRTASLDTSPSRH